LDFLDEEQPYAPRRAPAPRRRAPQPQQLRARRLAALGVGLIILILVVLGVKGCLNARKQRSLENYASDVTSLIRSTDQLSSDFFKLLNDPSSAGGISLSAALENISGGSEGLLQRAEQLSVPGGLSGAQTDLVLSYQLRRDGVSGFVSALQSGAGSKDAADSATSLAIYHLKEVIAGDVLFVHAKDQIDQVLSEESVSAHIPPSVFMQEPSKWLDAAAITPLLGSAGGSSLTGSTCPPKATCGLGITAASVGGVALSTTGPVTATGSTVDVSVQNQGTADESGVKVELRASGGISSDATVPSIKAGATKTVPLALKPAPASGQTVTVNVSVAPVEGEHVTSNNKATYQITIG
jgi:CARDB protein